MRVNAAFFAPMPRPSATHAPGASAEVLVLPQLTAIDQRLTAIDQRLTATEQVLRAVQGRVDALVPGSLVSAFNAMLAEQAAQLQWLAETARRVRTALGDLAADFAPAPAGTADADLLNIVGPQLARLGGDLGVKVDGPGGVEAMLASLFRST